MLCIKQEPIFKKLVKKYSDQLLDFYVANMLNNPKIWINELLSEECDDIFRGFIRKKESLTYVYKCDILLIMNEFDDINKAIKAKGDFPMLLKFVFQNKIQLETLLILNSFINIIEYWDTIFKGDLIWDPFKFKCDRYFPFMSFDKEKMNLIWKKEFNGILLMGDD